MVGNMILRVLGFVIMLVVIFAINLVMFRSSFPMGWLLTSVLSFIGLVKFPYTKYFKINELNK